jgi:hypothetical protein
MRTRSVVAGCTALLAFVLPKISYADAHEFTAQLDMRYVAVDSSLASFVDGGLGSLRFDERHEGLQLGRLLLDAAGPVTDTLRYTVTASGTDDGDRHALDLTEAYLEWRPYPRSALRWHVKAGAFYAPISLENRAIGWTSIYSLSPSAINSWIGEETRTLGLEVSSSLLGAFADRSYDITLLGALYRWNDPFGVLIFERGWAIHDRQSPLFGELPRTFASDPSNRSMQFFTEIDGRTGYYVGAEVKWRNDSLVRALHYDNRGDVDQSTRTEPDWLTTFEALGTRVMVTANITWLTQGMWGDTELGPQGNGQGMFVLHYWSYYSLLSYANQAHRVTARFDRMRTKTVRGEQFYNSEQDSHAWTLAYLFDLDDHWQFAVEALRISGTLEQRALLGLPTDQVERQLQVALRYTF